MKYLLYCLVTAFLARASGGGFGAQKLNKKGAVDDATGKDEGGIMPIDISFMPEVFFGFSFGFAHYLAFDSFLLYGLVSAWSYIWMETGHGTVLQWGNDPAAAQGERRQTLTPVVEFLSDRLGFVYGDRNYCRLFMAVKGFLIGLPVGGLPLAILWPLAYETKLWTKNHALTEIISGVFAGISILIFLALMR